MLLVSMAIVFFFLYFYQIETANTLREDFIRQNHTELTRGETYLLTKKLASFSKSPLVKCVFGYRGGLVFYEEKKASCKQGFLVKKVDIEEKNNRFLIEIYVHLPKSLSFGFLIFCVFQVLIFLLFFISEKNKILNALSAEVKYAAFAKQVAHDIRSPLAVLKLDSLSSKGRRILDRLEKILEDIQPENKKHHQFVDLEVLLMEVIDEAASFYKIIPTAIKLDISKEMAHEPMVDPIGWRRVISNVLNNAIESHREVPVAINIFCKVSDDRAFIKIIDSGEGISKKNARIAGEKSFTYGKEKGRGLGLLSTGNFLRKIRGSFKIYPLESRGSCAEIEFPRFGYYGVVLIDDDKDLITLWEKSGRTANYHFSSFQSLDNFLNSSAVDRRAEVFLDLNFSGHKLDIVDTYKKLSLRGYNRLFLATGQPIPRDAAENFIAVVGKEPPWL
ncbi:MAG: HAMP domain-containing histidine kinase [Oligoflexia bacterium]|nr:HAMP domain-containing histidine kinase [Oligoflexia bacterium]